MARTLITVPSSARRGEIIEVRVLIQHPMETGYRRSSEGSILPRNLLRRYTARFVAADAGGAGELVFAADLHAAIAANPYLSFNYRATTTGKFVFAWEGDEGFSHREETVLRVV
ncbi:MAG: thiosulfate oxidation carrier complex protein SoxZ [Burkholderiales bacterium]|jgi:sulfur-oxidizing protein SoxZ|nr:thiosulfate oxidation carrier complex protein SoxZ [Nitrosomonadaceae bacterium]